MINRVTLTGRLGADAEIKQSKSGKPYTRLNIATTTSYKDANDKWQETTYWHSVIINWRFEAKKGELAYIEGELTYYIGSDGIKYAQIKANMAKVFPTLNKSAKVAQETNSEEEKDELPF